MIMNTGIEFLPLIGRYCPRIKSLTNCSKKSRDLSFYRNYGHKLEELQNLSSKGVVKQILEFCPNLKKISIDSNAFICTKDKEFLPNLEIIYGIPIIRNSENVNQLKIFSNKYSQTIKSFNVWLWLISAEELKTCIECIARFENLKQLRLDFWQMKFFDKSLIEVMLSPNEMNVKHITHNCGLIN